MAKFRPEEKGGRIKPANYQCTYTADDIAELQRCTADPIYFIMNYCWIVHKKKGRIKFKLWDYQKKMIEMMMDPASPRCILNMPRQSGKCDYAETLIYRNGKLVPIWSLVKHTWKQKMIMMVEKIMVELALYVAKKSLVAGTQ